MQKHSFQKILEEMGLSANVFASHELETIDPTSLCFEFDADDDDGDDVVDDNTPAEFS